MSYIWWSDREVEAYVILTVLSTISPSAESLSEIIGQKVTNRRAERLKQRIRKKLSSYLEREIKYLTRFGYSYDQMLEGVTYREFKNE